MKTKRNAGMNRRDFLKLAAGLSMTPLVEKSISTKKPKQRTVSLLPNIIILVLDTLSARHLSLYGYPRKTSPNIDRFAERATVFHKHNSAANFTTPGTASLFTGTYPWQHRAYTLNGAIKEEVAPQNIFQYLHKKYYTAAFTQNINADRLLFQLDQYLDHHQPADSLNFTGKLIYNRLPDDDAIAGLRAFEKFMVKRDPPRGSLYVSLLRNISYFIRYRLAFRNLSKYFPLGMPSVHGDFAHFTIEKVMDGVISLLGELPVPFLAYIHLLPPHSPYRPNVDFHKMFNDKWAPPPTDRHPLGDGPKIDYHGKRQTYDEFIANLDNEVGRLLEYFEYSGLLENSYFILTSDHGELFEHGHRGHSTPLLFQPLLNIPLIMNTPGQNQREDIFTRTSSIDILPTLLQISGVDPAKKLDGMVLPLEDGDGESERNIWAMEAKNNSTFGPLDQTTLALFNGAKKLVYYYGYKNYKNQYELYNLESDPDELKNTLSTDPVFPELQSKLESKFNEIRNSLG